MAKSFGSPFSSASNASGAVTSSPLPRPRPAGQVASQPSSQQSLFGPMTTTRYEMAKAMLENAMAGASQSGSPALAFLAPIMGGAVGAGLEKRRDAAAQSRQDTYNQIAENFLGRPLGENEIEAMRVMEDPDAPSFVKQLAQMMMKSRAPSSGAPTRRSAPRSTAPANSRSRLYGEYEIDGVLYGRDKYGQMRPYEGPNGPVNVSGPEAPGSAASDPLAPDTPTMPSDPARDDDPLGIR